jgi:hypothetical protein
MRTIARSEIGCGQSAFIDVVNKRHGLRWPPPLLAPRRGGEYGDGSGQHRAGLRMNGKHRMSSARTTSARRRAFVA